MHPARDRRAEERDDDRRGDRSADDRERELEAALARCRGANRGSPGSSRGGAARYPGDRPRPRPARTRRRCRGGRPAQVVGSPGAGPIASGGRDVSTGVLRPISAASTRQARTTTARAIVWSRTFQSPTVAIGLNDSSMTARTGTRGGTRGQSTGRARSRVRVDAKSRGPRRAPGASGNALNASRLRCDGDTRDLCRGRPVERPDQDARLVGLAQAGPKSSTVSGSVVHPASATPWPPPTNPRYRSRRTRRGTRRCRGRCRWCSSRRRSPRRPPPCRHRPSSGRAARRRRGGRCWRCSCGGP